MITQFTLETVSGKLLDPSNIDPAEIDIHDISWSLSRISRFAGHTITSQPYVVGQHCIFVADLILSGTGNKSAAFLGLLHDAAECYIGDIPSPIKKVPALKAVIGPIEDAIMEAVVRKFMGITIDEDTLSTVKYYDKKAQYIEAFHFMSSRGLQWPDRDNYEVTMLDLQNFPEPMTSVHAYKAFLDKFVELQQLTKI